MMRPMPSISEYVESIRLSSDTFKSLKLKPIKEPGTGRPVLVAGNQAVVFQMFDIEARRLKAVKCYTSLSEYQHQRLSQITHYFQENPSDLLLPAKYLSDELWVESSQTPFQEFPVLIMDWGGMTLGKYIAMRCGIGDRVNLHRLAASFNAFAYNLLQQPFAHGDIKPDNLIFDSATHKFRLIDFDGMFLPGMEGSAAQEHGSPGYRHPRRDQSYYNASIDDFPLLVTSLSLYLLAHFPQWFTDFSNGDSLLFTQEDLENPRHSRIFSKIRKKTLPDFYTSMLEKLHEALAHPPGAIRGLSSLFNVHERR